MKLLSRAVKLLVIAAPAILSAVPAEADDWWFGRGKSIRGSGDLVTEERTIGDFGRIRSGVSFDIEVTVGPEPSLSVTYDDNLIEFVITEVRHGTLYVGTDKSLSSRHGCQIKVSVPKLEKVTISGSGDVEIDGLTGDKFTFAGSGSGDLLADGEVDLLEVRISGSGDVRLDEIKAKECYIKIKGSGDVRARGTVDDLEVDISGSGDVDARDLVTKNAYIEVDGSGDTKIHVTGVLDGRIDGSGDIYYYGDPERTSVEVNGSGDLRPRR